MSEFQNLRTLLTVRELGSFQRAGSALNVSQPAISKRIRTLEMTLGCKLIDRRDGKFQLTEKGSIVASEAEDIVESYFLLHQRVSGRSAIFQRLELGVVESILLSWFPDFLLRLREEFRDIDINLHCNPTHELEQKLSDRKIDVAFMMGPSNNGDKVYTPCDTAELCFVADKRLPLPRHDLASLTNQKLSLITFTAGSKPHTDLLFALKPHLPRKSVPLISSSSISTMLHLVRSLQGVAVLPRSFLDDESLYEVHFGVELPILSFASCFLKSRSNPVYQKISQIAASAAHAHSTPKT